MNGALLKGSDVSAHQEPYNHCIHDAVGDVVTFSDMAYDYVMYGAFAQECFSRFKTDFNIQDMASDVYVCWAVNERDGTGDILAILDMSIFQAKYAQDVPDKGTGVYESSIDFMADLSELGASLEQAKKILDKPEFAHWMRATDELGNTGGTFQVIYEKLIPVVRHADDIASMLDQQICNIDQ